jgi:hypothetical protein
MSVLSAMRAAWATELREIERRKYSEPLDYTRAAIIRACIKSVDIDIAREAT